MNNSPLWKIRFFRGYYMLENQKTGKVINTGFDTQDVSEDFIRTKYAKALSKLAR